MVICIGIALSVAVGFRVFTLLLFTSLVAHSNWIVMAEGFEWVGSSPALIAFSVAPVVSINRRYYSNHYSYFGGGHHFIINNLIYQKCKETFL